MDTRLPTRKLRIFLRDFRQLEAQVSFGHGQSLATYFANRKSYLNVRDAHWSGQHEKAEHAVVRVDQVLWVVALEGDVSLTHASAPGEQRRIELQLEGGFHLRAGIVLGDQQRLSDHLESAGQFIPLTGAQLLRSGRPPREVNVELGEIILNQVAIQAAWEIDPKPAPPRPRRPRRPRPAS